MAERRPPALKLPIACKPPATQATPPVPPEQQEQDAVQHVQQDPVQPPAPPAQVPNPVQPLQIQVQPGQPQLNWSYFKPEFSGKPEEDEEAHDWMDSHNFTEIAKVQRFCLTLTREARLWYESLRPIATDWTGLQEQFRQQYLKFGNT